MILRWNRVLVLALTSSSLLNAPVASAAGTKRPSEVNYSRTPVIESHANALSNSWKEVDKSVDRSAADLSRAVSKYSSQLEKAESYRAASAAMLVKKKADIAAYRSELKSLGAEVTRLSEAPPSPEVSKMLAGASQSLSSKTSQINTLEREAAELQSNYEKANAKAQELRGQVAKTLDQDFKVRIDPNADVRSQLAQLGDDHIKQAKLTHAVRVTDQFLDEVKSDYLKSGLLVADLEALKQQRNYTDAQIGLLQEKLSARLDKTILGKYVHDQVGKAMMALCQNQAAWAACTAGNASTLQDLLRGVMGGNPGENYSSSKKEPSAKPNAKPGAGEAARANSSL
jgi:hypothetical protein